MGKREVLHELLCELLGSRNCYFDPPTELKMSYPCIRYNSVGNDFQFADNKIYRMHKQYELTIIDPDSESEIPGRLINALPYLTPGREYYSDGLKHFPFTLYY